MLYSKTYHLSFKVANFCVIILILGDTIVSWFVKLICLLTILSNSYVMFSVCNQWDCTLTDYNVHYCYVELLLMRTGVRD